VAAGEERHEEELDDVALPDDPLFDLVRQARPHPLDLLDELILARPEDAGAR